MSRLIDQFSEFFAHRKGLLPLLGLLLVAINLVLTLLLPEGHFLVRTSLCLHLGVILAILGMLLAWAL